MISNTVAQTVDLLVLTLTAGKPSSVEPILAFHLIQELGCEPEDEDRAVWTAYENAVEDYNNMEVFDE